MTFEYSLLTVIVSAIAVIFTLATSYKMNKNFKLAFFHALFSYSVTSLVFFVLLPLQVTDTALFKIGSGVEVKNFFVANFDGDWFGGGSNGVAAITTGILFAASGYIVSKKMRKPLFALGITLLALAVYVGEGMFENLLWQVYVKDIYITDMILFTVSMLIGFVAAYAYCKSQPKFLESLEKTKKVDKNKKDLYKDMNEL